MRALAVRSLTFGLFVAALSGGCKTSTCDVDAATVSVRSVKDDSDPGAIISGVTVGNTYESGPIDGPWVDFPPNRTLVFHHGFGVKPFQIVPYVSFDSSGSSAPSAGNSSIFVGSDCETITMKNDTCSEFWIRVTAISRPTPLPEDLCSDAGTSEAAGAGGMSSEAAMGGESGAAGP